METAYNASSQHVLFQHEPLASSDLRQHYFSCRFLCLHLFQFGEVMWGCSVHSCFCSCQPINSSVCLHPIPPFLSKNLAMLNCCCAAHRCKNTVILWNYFPIHPKHPSLVTTSVHSLWAPNSHVRSATVFVRSATSLLSLFPSNSPCTSTSCHAHMSSQSDILQVLHMGSV